MFSYLVVVLLCYFLYDGVSSLIQHEGPFELAQWLMVGLCVLYVPIIILAGIRAVKTYKESKVKREEEEIKQREELAARKRRFYLDEDEPQVTDDVQPDDYDDYDDDEIIEAESSEIDDNGEESEAVEVDEDSEETD